MGATPLYNSILANRDAPQLHSPRLTYSFAIQTNIKQTIPKIAIQGERLTLHIYGRRGFPRANSSNP